MLLSTTTGNYIKRGVTEDAMLDMVKDAGFDAMDFSFHINKVFHDETTGSKCSTVEYFKELRKKAESKGLVFNQGHAPAASSFTDENETKLRFTQIVTSMKFAGVLGIKNIVVHPCQHLTYANEGVPGKLYEINMDFYNRLKPYCEEYGVKVAVENMWQYLKGDTISHSTCSRPDEFIKYLDSLDKKWFTGCLDIGHAMLVREDIAEFIKKLGADRLGCIHAHDVLPNFDSHTIPFQGVIDWNKVCAAFKEIGYRGDFTYEVSGSFLGYMPVELLASGTKLLGDTGRYLVDKITK